MRISCCPWYPKSLNFISTKTYDTGVTTDPLLVEGLIRKALEFAEVSVVE